MSLYTDPRELWFTRFLLGIVALMAVGTWASWWSTYEALFGIAFAVPLSALVARCR